VRASQQVASPVCPHRFLHHRRVTRSDGVPEGLAPVPCPQMPLAQPGVHAAVGFGGVGKKYLRRCCPHERRRTILPVLSRAGEQWAVAVLTEAGEVPRLVPLTEDEGRHLLGDGVRDRSEEHTSELQSRFDLVCRLLLEKKKKIEKR